MFSNLIKSSVPTNFIYILLIVITGWWSVFNNSLLFSWNINNSILFSLLPSNFIKIGAIGFISILIIILISLLLISFTTLYFHGITGNVLPTVIFLIISSQLTWISSQGLSLFSALIYLLVVRNLFQTYHQNNVFKYIFNAGFFTGISTIIYLPSIFILIASWLTIILLRKFNFREFLTLLLGAALPLAFFHVWVLYVGNEQIVYNVILNNLTIHYFEYINNKQLLWILFFSVLIIWCLVKSLTSGILKKIAIRRYYYSFAIIILIYFALLLSVYDEKGMIAIILIPASYIISFSISSIRKNIVADIVILILIAMQIFVQLPFLK